MANTRKKLTIVHWFRKGLRVHDNPALTEAVSKVQTNPELFCLRPTFILDTEIIKWLRVGPNRWRFLQQSLQQLDDNLRGIKTRLYVIRGNPDTVFPRIFIEWNIKLLTFEVDIEPYSRVRDEKIELLAKQAGVKIIQRVSHTIYDTEAVIRKNMGKAPLTYQKFLSVVDDLPVPGPSLPPPSDIPDSCKPQKDSIEIDNSTCYDVPTLHELGVEIENCGPCLYPGGESESLARLEKFISMKQWICKFEKPNTAPNSLEPSTTVLSPYLKFGCLSSRLFYHKLREVLRGTKHSQPPVSLMGQLMWREFYYAVGAATNNFDKMLGNTVCCQVPWDENETFLNAWTNGLTGYPFIDAIMRQLRQEGWIHHLARHAVACFLTRGDLWISWEKGQKVFEELLLDADWALNAGNWMWLSASAFFHQFYRVYSPVAFGKKTDKNGDFIKKYVPEVSKMPVEYIYEPWKAPLGVQRQVNCVLGKDYPHRIVIHEDVYKNNISKMSEAYKNNKERINQSANMCVKRKQDAAVASPTKRANKDQQKITSMFKKK